MREWEEILDRRFIDASPSLLFAEVEQSVLAVPDPVLATLHSTALAEYGRRLVCRYGYWGLASLETLLVLADHQQSEAERDAQPEHS